MGDAGAAIARFDFANGLLRGSQLTLYPACLVHQGEGTAETLMLASIASVRIVFERDSRRLGWGLALLLVAVVLLALSSPLASFAAGAAAEIAAAGTQGVAHALQAMFGLLEGFARMLPILALMSALGGAALALLGWVGSTRLTVIFAGQERDYPARGRNAGLFDFAELLAGQLVSLKR